MKKILILVLCLLFFTLGIAKSLKAGAAEKTETDLNQTTTESETPSNLSLFWQETKETFRILFAWNNIEKTKIAMDLADKKLEDYKVYRAQQKDKLAERSLKRYQKEIEIVLDVLEKESDPQKAEQIAEEVKERMLKSIVELEVLYEEAPSSFKERISQIISKLQGSYKISQDIMNGEYQEVSQTWWNQFKTKLKEGLKKIYYKLWPISQ